MCVVGKTKRQLLIVVKKAPCGSISCSRYGLLATSTDFQIDVYHSIADKNRWERPRVHAFCAGGCGQIA